LKVADHTYTTVVAVFRDSDKARDAIEALKNAGFASQDIGVLMRDKGETKDFAAETGSHAGEGAATGAIGGGILGGLAGWLVGIGALVIPGVGPFVAAGAFGTALAGAGVGAGVGLIAGALVGMGIPEEEADWYEGEVKSGNTLVSVIASDRYDEARGLLRKYGAYDVHDRSGMAGTGTMDSAGTYDTGRSGSYGTGRVESREGGQFTDRGSTTEDERTMRLREEELRVRQEQGKVE